MRSRCLGTDQEMKREREQRTPERVIEVGLARLKFMGKGEETMVPVIHMISTWKLYLTFKVMFMFIF